MHFCLPLTNLVAGKQKDKHTADTGMDKTPRLKFGWMDRQTHTRTGRPAGRQAGRQVGRQNVPI
jgi:hypothetical protein